MTTRLPWLSLRTSLHFHLGGQLLGWMHEQQELKTRLASISFRATGGKARDCWGQEGLLPQGPRAAPPMGPAWVGSSSSLAQLTHVDYERDALDQTTA